VESIGGYEVLDELGRGGMGVVYRARDPRSGRSVALKLLLALSDPEERLRFQREIETTRSLDHPHVLRVLDLGQDRGRPFLVTELAEGGSLAGRLREQALDPGEAARVVAEVASGLAAAHRSGALHRDLKPANVLFAGDGRSLLADFGLARRLRDETLTATGTVLGTPGYMSPEQARGERADERSDVYGLGSLLYASLSGGPPFRRASLLATLAAVVNDPVPPLAAEVPEALAAICCRCLAKDPAERYADADEVSAALNTWRDALTRPRLARGAALAVACAALALGAAALGASSLPHGAPPPQHSPTPSARGSALPSPPPELEAARAAARRSDWESVLASAQRALERGPHRAEALTLAGWARLERAELEAAREQLDEALRAAPDYPLALALRALLHALKKEWKLARRLAKDAQSRASEDSEVVVQVARAHLHMGEFEQARRQLQKTLPARPRDAVAHFLHARACLECGEEEPALQGFERVLELEPDHYLSLAHAAALLATRDRSRGLERYRSFLTLSQEALLEAEGNADLLRKVRDLAWPQLRRLVPLYPEELLGHYLRGEVLLRRREYEAARKELDEVLRLNGGRPYERSALYLGVAHRSLAKAEGLGERERAAHLERGVALAGMHLEQHPEDVDALTMRAGCLLLLRRFEKAYLDLSRAHQLRPTTDSACDLASAALETGRLAESRGLVEPLQFESRRARFGLARVLGRGDAEEQARARALFEDLARGDDAFARSARRILAPTPRVTPDRR